MHIAAENKGKRESHRAILAFKQGDKTIFLTGFSKNDIDNISKKIKNTTQNRQK